MPEKANDIMHSDCTYSESAEGVVISRKRAIQELKRHNHDSHEAIEEFYATCGVRERYDASEVLSYLGY